jgi:DNA polymerase-1
MTRDQAVQAARVLKALIKYAEAAKILGTFINALKEKSVLKEDGNYYLHGNFNMNGTKSGRQSSSSPNLTNLPSGSTYGKLIKSCFKSPKGRVMIGADFDALEDKVSALTTRDPNKMAVYESGYDGHSLRCFYYFRDQLAGIIDTVESINSIADKFPKLRQASKAPTFLLTYGGTYHGLVTNVGFKKEEALHIEKNYHELYKVSDEWVQTKLIEATKNGYVTLAFGLRLRTPILAQSILTSSSVPYEAKAESRTAANALGQSYGMLNNRSAIEFQRRIWNSTYALDILPICAIHDSQYFSVADNAECIEWFNNNLIECMSWTGLPEIQHDIVKISATAEIFYPSWEVSAKLPNRSTQAEITAIGRAAHKKYLEELTNAVG